MPTDERFAALHGLPSPQLRRKLQRANFAATNATAGRGDVNAIFNRALMQLFGANTTPDPKNGFHGLASLAAGGHLEARYLYGYCLRHGYGLRRDRRAGFKLLLEAAQCGHSSAQFVVAVCFPIG
jgi:TPR repeat protein